VRPEAELQSIGHATRRGSVNLINGSESMHLMSGGCRHRLHKRVGTRRHKWARSQHCFLLGRVQFLPEWIFHNVTKRKKENSCIENCFNNKGRIPAHVGWCAQLLLRPTSRVHLLNVAFRHLPPWPLLPT